MRPAAHLVSVLSLLATTTNALIADHALCEHKFRLIPLEAMTPREMEIQRKIRQLKKKTSEPDTANDNDYTSRIRQKLGTRKSKLLGYGNEETLYDSNEKDDKDDSIDPQEDLSIADLADDDLTKIVAEKLLERSARQRQDDSVSNEIQAMDLQPATSQKITTGIGGTWQSETKKDAQEDVYQPKTGSWGAFPRPRDISKAYGGGRRIGPGFSNEKARAESVEETRARLQQYRQKVGIEVESEKEHANEINEALNIGTLAMERGMYSTAVNALEKVTKYCSTNSKLGSKIFIELGMAYEAAGRTSEAITVYSSLTNSRMEETKNQAKRLLYGIEAMQFMRENVNESAFSRKRATSVFIDTTGLSNIASKFDDVYETAYVDLSQSFYKKLTESVVRSSREARQIILQASGPGEVERIRIVQALRSLSRNFADALQNEIDSTIVQEPVAFIDGKPIMPSPQSTTNLKIDEGFNLMESQQMLENLDGEWRLQLIADKRGDGVKFFNTTLAWQVFDTETMTFRAVAPRGFLNVEQSGGIKFNRKRRILRRNSVESSGPTAFTDLFGAKLGALGAIRTERQLIMVDSSILITRGVPSNDENEKDFFAVWRRADRGTFG